MINQEQMNAKDQDEFHDIVDETEPPDMSVKRIMSFFYCVYCLMLKGKVELHCHPFCTPPEAISEICAVETGNLPKRMSPLLCCLREFE